MSTADADAEIVACLFINETSSDAILGVTLDKMGNGGGGKGRAKETSNDKRGAAANAGTPLTDGASSSLCAALLNTTGTEPPA